MPDSQPSLAPPHTVTLIGTFPLRTGEEVGACSDVPLFRTCRCPESWEADENAARYGDFTAPLAEELRTAGPHFTAVLPTSALVGAVPATLRSVAATFAGNPVRLSLSGGRIGVTAVGYGAVVLAYDVEIGTGAGPELVDLSLSMAVKDDVDRFVQELVSDVAAEGSDHAVSGLPCLWIHVVHHFDHDAPDLPGLAPTTDEQPPVVVLHDGLVRPGLGSTVTVGSSQVNDTAVRVVSLLSAYYAAMADVDRRVFKQLVHWQARPTRDAGPTADETYEEVSLFRAVLQTLDMHLAASVAGEVRIWRALAEVWRVPQQLDALTDKLDLLRAFQDRETQQASLRRAERLTSVALAFTVLSFLGVLLDLVDFGQADGLARPDPWRSVLSLGLAGALVAAFSASLGARRRAAAKL